MTANSSWATSRRHDPDWSDRNPSAQLGACQAVLDAASCCALCSSTLGCLAYTYVDVPSRDVPFTPRLPRRCCLKQHRPRHKPFSVAGCTTGVLTSAPCRAHCMLPLPHDQRESTVAMPRNANASHFPWLLLQRPPAPPPPPAPSRPSGAPEKSRSAPGAPRVAVCIAGTPRALVHPTVWRSIEQHILRRHYVQQRNSESDEHRMDAFVVLSTATEDSPDEAAARAREYTPAPDVIERWQWREAYSHGRVQVMGWEPWSWEQGDGQSELLARALSGLRPRGVRMRTRAANISCGLPPSAQFGRWADCVELAEAYERRIGSRYTALLKVRTDQVYKWRLAQRQPLAEIAASLYADVIVSIDDLVLLVPRQQWHVLRAMRPPMLRCPRLCNAQYKSEFPALLGWNLPTHCLMRTHFARFGVRLTDLRPMLMPETILLDTSLRAAMPLGSIGMLDASALAKIIRLQPTTHATITHPIDTNPTITRAHAHATGHATRDVTGGGAQSEALSTVHSYLPSPSEPVLCEHYSSLLGAPQSVPSPLRDGRMASTWSMQGSSSTDRSRASSRQDGWVSGSSCAAYQPSFRCFRCSEEAHEQGAVGQTWQAGWRAGHHEGGRTAGTRRARHRAECSEVRDIFPPQPRGALPPYTTAGLLAGGGAMGSAIECLNTSVCTTRGCAALAAVVPLDAHGGTFRVGKEAVDASGGCVRVRRAVCLGLGLSRGCMKHAGCRKGGGGRTSALEILPTALADVRLTEVACSLRPRSVNGHVNGSDGLDRLISSSLRLLRSSGLGHGPRGSGLVGGGALLHSSLSSWRLNKTQSWLAHYVLLMLEDRIVRRLIQSANGSTEGEARRLAIGRRLC